MKALLLKDFYVMWKQMKSFLIFILIFSAIPNAFNNAFAIIYAAMMPYSTLAYDERGKWNQLAAMMPYSIRDMVLSKYVFGWVCIAVAAGLSVLMQTILAFFVETVSFLPFVGIGICMALSIMSISLPLMFRFGVEKGRLWMLLIIALIGGSAGAVGALAESGGIDVGPLRVFPPMIALVLTAISIPLSIKLYPKRT